MLHYEQNAPSTDYLPGGQAEEHSSSMTNASGSLLEMADLWSGGSNKGSADDLCWNRQTAALQLAASLLIAPCRPAARVHSAGRIDVLQMSTGSLLLCTELSLNERCYDTPQPV